MRLLLWCLLLRSSWLTVEGGRQVGAARVLHRQGEPAGVAVPVDVAGRAPLQQRAVPRAALLHFADAAVCDPASACSRLQASRGCPRRAAPIALKRGLGVGAVAVTERRAPNRPAQRRLGLCVLGRGSEAGVRTPPQRTRPIWLWRVGDPRWRSSPSMRTRCFPARARIAVATGPGSLPRDHGVRARRVAPGSEFWLGQIDRATSSEWGVLARRGLCGLTGRGADAALTAQTATYP